MGATDVQRAQQWLDRTGGLPAVPAVAGDLLTRRLAERRRLGRRWVLPAGAVAALLLLWTLVDTLVSGPTDHRAWQHFAYRYVGVIAVLGLARLGVLGSVARAERRLAAGLPERVSRGRQVPLREVLGPARWRYLLVALGLEAAGAVALVLVDGGWLAALYVPLLVGVLVLVAVGVRLAVDRPTVAVDAVSLAVDERLRSEEVLLAVAPLSLVVFAFPPVLVAQAPAAWLALPWGVCGIGLAVLWAVVQARQPWTSPGRGPSAPVGRAAR